MAKGIRIEGLVSRKVIRAWLESWDQDEHAPVLDAVATNSGPKNSDGVSGRMINRIMLEAAIADLPPVLKVCITFRWLEQLTLRETLQRTGIPKSTYYRRCDKAVDFIYYHVNGIAAGIKDLLDKLE